MSLVGKEWFAFSLSTGCSMCAGWSWPWMHVLIHWLLEICWSWIETNMKSVECSKFNYPGKSKGEGVPVHATKPYGGVEVQYHAVISAPGVGVSPASKSQPLYLQKEPHYLLNTSLEGPHNESKFWRTDNSLVPTGNQIIILWSPST